MELITFSVTNFRSITKAYKLPLGQKTILIGPNNEGKSNILRALVLSLEVLRSFRILQIRKGKSRFYPHELGNYDWHRDYPISLQRTCPSGESIFSLEFRLNSSEIQEFKKEVKSDLNGTLPIQLSLGLYEPKFRVRKKGFGGKALSKKDDSIAQFISKRVNIAYIPSIRTSEQSNEIINAIVEKELEAVENDPGFREALEAAARIQAPVLEKISKSVTHTLKDFLPTVRTVKILLPKEARYRAMRGSCEIIIDDGTPTSLGRKGDGVQSLAALALMRHTSETGALGRHLILAIEEPESHLHPSAIHQLRTVLSEIAKAHQVIMTTHCPLLVARNDIRSNIIVDRNKATTAKDIARIRDMLGVRAADNLRHAELILYVEGEEDKRVIQSLIIHYSPTIAAATRGQILMIESLQGGTNLGYKVSQAITALCSFHCFLDNDNAANIAVQKAIKENLLTIADINLSVCIGMKESEIEDLYNLEIYSEHVLGEYGVNLNVSSFKKNKKWSDRIKELFRNQGKPFNDDIKSKLKAEIAGIVLRNPAAALNPHKRSSFDALVKGLEVKLAKLSPGFGR